MVCHFLTRVTLTGGSAGSGGAASVAPAITLQIPDDAGMLYTPRRDETVIRDPRETTDLKDREPSRFLAMRKRLEALNAEILSEGPDWWKRLTPNGGMPLKK